MNYGSAPLSRLVTVDPVVSLVTGSWENLLVQTRALPSTDARIQIKCDRILLVNDDGLAILARNVHLGEQPDPTYPGTIMVNGSVRGVNGLDEGTLSADLWYYIWLIATADGGRVRGLLSLSPSRPELPGGYTHFNRVGAAFYQSGAFLSFVQRDNQVMVRTAMVMNNQMPYAGQNLTMVLIGSDATNGAILRSRVPPPPVSRTVHLRAMSSSTALSCYVRLAASKRDVGIEGVGGHRVQQNNLGTNWDTFNAGRDIVIPMRQHDVYWGSDAPLPSNGVAIMGWTL